MASNKSTSGGQKSIGRDRAPRVQIEYDVEVYGSQKKVMLPFVTGVMSDLSGDREGNIPPMEERDFVEISEDNFERVMSAINPKVKCFVDNTLSGDDSTLNVDLEFKSMQDFEPGEIAKRIPELNELLQARKELNNLITYMDGKVDAEQVIERLLQDKDWLVKLASGAGGAAVEEAQESLVEEKDSISKGDAGKDDDKEKKG